MKCEMKSEMEDSPIMYEAKSAENQRIKSGLVSVCGAGFKNQSCSECLETHFGFGFFQI